MPGDSDLSIQKVLRSFVRFPSAALHSRLRTRRGTSVRTAVPTDVAEVLDRVRALPISTWSYDYDHSTVRHLGPMAQDFSASFGLGDSDRRIDVVDSAGVALAAIQALARRVEELELRLATMERTTPDARVDREPR